MFLRWSEMIKSMKARAGDLGRLSPSTLQGYRKLHAGARAVFSRLGAGRDHVAYYPGPRRTCG